jgi:hypothetical protein
VTKQKYRKNFEKILHRLYETEIIEEEAILSWVEEQNETEDKTFLNLV